ncbi:MAG: glycosyltransferase family 39 protein [Alphaproteobacteria bacterium]|nr:glycosyltransferase family 39 protein [Alphaproteobacteria bacterium]
MLETLEKIPQSFFSKDGKNLSLVAYAFLVLLSLAFFIPGIVSMPPTDRDEASFAQATKQMIETGNYTDIRLQEKPRYNKPIGIYWLQSAAVQTLTPQSPDQIWAYRIPSLVGALLAVVMTAVLGSILFSPQAGLLAAMMMAGCVLLNVEARLAKTDAVLLACIVTTMAAMAKARMSWSRSKEDEKESPPPRSRAILLNAFVFWTAFALGVLVKGPIILLPVIGVVFWIGLSEKKWAWIRSLRPATGLFYALALIAPWFVAILMQSHGAFFEQSAGRDMLAKIWEGQNRGLLPPGLHTLAFPILFFPFALFSILAIPTIWKKRKETAVSFCLGWIIPTWLVFEFSMTKLPHYVLPAYPAIALLTAYALLQGLPVLTAPKHRIPVALIVGFWFMLGTSFAFIFALLPSFTNGILNVPQSVAGGLLILTLGLVLVILLKRKVASLVILTIGSLIFLATTFGYTIPRLKHVWISRDIVAAAATINPCIQPARLIALGYHEPSLVFLSGTDTIMAKTGGDAAQALQEDSCRVAVVSREKEASFLAAFQAQQPQKVEEIEGLNSGRGKGTTLSLFVMPKIEPVAP